MLRVRRSGAELADVGSNRAGRLRHQTSSWTASSIAVAAAVVVREVGHLSHDDATTVSRETMYDCRLVNLVSRAASDPTSPTRLSVSGTSFTATHP